MAGSLSERYIRRGQMEDAGRFLQLFAGGLTPSVNLLVELLCCLLHRFTALAQSRAGRFRLSLQLRGNIEGTESGGVQHGVEIGGFAVARTQNDHMTVVVALHERE